MGSSGPAGPRRKIEAVFASFLWTAGSGKFETWRYTSSRPLLGMINVIFAALGRTGSCPFRVMFVARLSAKDSNSKPKRARVDIQPALSFSKEDKIGTIQPHDNALVVTLRIRGYDVKRVMVD